ncbi:putative inactive histone-lysine N-methyltransferase SUVR2 [Bidens hawaiensis]|uniref:putative inactive histone-lysine N-methyltransferase SUVR2 n=1 Tax=Bidens hawaiensis TaxID=980011 RepID=UPI00404BA369
MAPNPRVTRAFRAMRELGIPDERTKPVLKNLLRLYDKNWELIEHENYRVLADAIFDDESEVTQPKKKLDDAEAAEKKRIELAERMKAIEEEPQIPEEPEKPLKRLRVRHLDDQASASCINPHTSSSGSLLKVPKLEVNELPESRPEPLSPVEIAETGPFLRTNSHPVSPLKQADLPVIVMKLIDEPLTDDPPSVEFPIASTMTESLTDEDTSTENNLVEEPEPTKTMNLKNRVQETSNETNVSTAKIDIASSSSSSSDLAPDHNGQPPVNTDATSPTENGFEEDNHFVPDENVDMDKEQESVVNTDNISPTDSFKTANDFEKDTENKIDENNHFIPDETVDMDKKRESVLNTDNISPTDSLKTVNDFEKETENGVDENIHFSSDKIIDIAKGEEGVIISLVNEVNTKRLLSFTYIPKNAVFQNAYVNLSLACITNKNCCSTCSGNCLSSSTPCQCALQTGGEFAYSDEGTIKEDILDNCIQTNRDPQKCQLLYCKECPLEKLKNEGLLGNCKGHFDRSFIKECWLKCGCYKKCGNRVVQSGIRYKLQVFMTPDSKGWGLRALEDLPKGAFVCEFVGEVLTCKELFNRVSQSSKEDEYAYPVFLDAEWGEENNESKEDEALCLDATYFGNVARFINHRCFDPNLVEIPVEVENPDRHYYHVAFFTTRKVKALEELTRDYGINFDDDDLVKAFECQCGSSFCRNIKGSSGFRKRKCAED